MPSSLHQQGTPLSAGNPGRERYSNPKLWHPSFLANPVLDKSKYNIKQPDRKWQNQNPKAGAVGAKDSWGRSSKLSCLALPRTYE